MHSLEYLIDIHSILRIWPKWRINFGRLGERARLNTLNVHSIPLSMHFIPQQGRYYSGPLPTASSSTLASWLEVQDRYIVKTRISSMSSAPKFIFLYSSHWWRSGMHLIIILCVIWIPQYVLVIFVSNGIGILAYLIGSPWISRNIMMWRRQRRRRQRVNWAKNIGWWDTGQAT